MKKILNIDLHISVIADIINVFKQVNENIEIEKGTWKGRVVTKIDNLCLEWNAIWFATPDEQHIPGEDGHERDVRSLLMQLKLLC